MRKKPVTRTRTGGVREAGPAHELGAEGGCPIVQPKPRSVRPKRICAEPYQFSEESYWAFTENLAAGHDFFN